MTHTIEGGPMRRVLFLLVVASVLFPPTTVQAQEIVTIEGAFTLQPEGVYADDFIRLVETTEENSVVYEAASGGGPASGTGRLVTISEVTQGACVQTYRSTFVVTYTGTWEPQSLTFTGTWTATFDHTLVSESGDCEGTGYNKTIEPLSGEWRAPVDPSTGTVTDKKVNYLPILDVDSATLDRLVNPGGPGPNTEDSPSASSGTQATDGISIWLFVSLAVALIAAAGALARRRRPRGETAIDGRDDAPDPGRDDWGTSFDAVRERTQYVEMTSEAQRTELVAAIATVATAMGGGPHIWHLRAAADAIHQGDAPAALDSLDRARKSHRLAEGGPDETTDSEVRAYLDAIQGHQGPPMEPHIGEIILGARSTTHRAPRAEPEPDPVAGDPPRDHPDHRAQEAAGDEPDPRHCGPDVTAAYVAALNRTSGRLLDAVIDTTTLRLPGAGVEFLRRNGPFMDFWVKARSGDLCGRGCPGSVHKGRFMVLTFDGKCYPGHFFNDAIFGLVTGLLGVTETVAGLGARFAEYQAYGDAFTAGEAISQKIYPKARALGIRWVEGMTKITTADVTRVFAAGGTTKDCAPCREVADLDRDVFRDFSAIDWDWVTTTFAKPKRGRR